jgi:hypothetical protein
LNMGIRSGGKKSPEPHETESTWCGFGRDFQSLASARAKPQLLTASEKSAAESGNGGSWVFSPPFLVLERFKEVAQRSGGRLGASKDFDPIDFWLDCLFLYLWRYGKRKGVRILNTGFDQRERVISDVIEASERFSSWLSKSGGNVVRLLREKSSVSWQQTPPLVQGAQESLGTGGGEVWAAQKNREAEARASIVEALQRKGIPQKEWPDFVRNWYEKAHTQPRFSYGKSFPSFQPPPYERLDESIEEWKRRADADWVKHRDRFVSKWQFEEKLGLDEEIPLHKKIRGSGSGRARRNAEIRDRYTWAGLRLCGLGWKQIAAEFDVDESTVNKAANRVLRTAGWPTALSVINAARESAAPGNRNE